MDCFPERGKLNVEGCALSGSRTYIDLSCMLFDYTVADGQAQACAAAVRFGGEKWVENTMNVLAGNARAGVGNFDFDAAIVGGCATSERVSSTTRLTSISANSAAPVREKFRRLLTISLARKVCLTILSMIA